jgi:uncharacterized protein
VRAVLDANVVAAGIGWQGEGWLCLVRMAQRHFTAFATESTLAETRETALRLMREKSWKHNAAGRLAWYIERLHLVEEMPLGKTRSRDADDDFYLACALAARAEFLVTWDKDLLVLGRPFGIHILTPAQFLKRIEEEEV